MAKLYFKYSSMGAGKSLDLLKTNYNYEERGKNVIRLTSSRDDRYGENIITSRVGISKSAIGITDEMNIFDFITNYENSIDCILVDEVQFFKKHHIYELSDIVDILNIPVICYGIRSDFQTEPFEGSLYLLTIADEIEELKTLCSKCNKKAILNIRYKINNDTIKIITEGDQVEIGGNDNYMPLCRKCYKKLLNNL